ncbi:Atxe2 family lasso peptide isopeptidase [Sphingobium sp. BHU LFT2]|uniref:Atxe2 family lasso peptide isopeptidase n=1 Tax=Sphingobium sp. BHU LFT2 TaxID=2807634 RepID=UPI001BECC96E|nr:Atxe2 family lasso peptide isopeptidase [Sphingobium sp. BHU LFT2]MBT2246837.1 Atxe2 family lasso peptide isopeptidase [Sphingobium sp. BHU LFT2]
MSRNVYAACAIAVLGACSLSTAVRAEPSCSSLVPNGEMASRRGPITLEALAGLRDIGPSPRPDRTRSIFSLSPDGRKIAFQIHRGHPSENRYCVGIVVISAEQPAPPETVDISDELIFDAPARYSWASFQIGAPLPTAPRWSRDGRSIFYLKRVGGTTQIWKADLTTKSVEQLTHATVDVDDFRISPDGRGIDYVLRPGVKLNSAAIDREGLTGWRYDERAFPVRGARPQTPASDRVYVTIDIETRVEQPSDKLVINDFMQSTADASRIDLGVSLLGDSAFGERIETALFPEDYRIVVETAAGRRQPCPLEECRSGWLAPLWWTPDGRKLRFFRREGWANSLTAIYEWLPGSRTVQRLLLTSDYLVECQPIGRDLVCLRERSREPRHFVRIDLDHKREKRIFDPNPEFASLILGKVERLNWRNSAGIPFYGDLVYPVGYAKGRRYPLIIVQYRTKGFLRGGIGDEFPIQAFADRGYFVLSVDNLTYEEILGKRDSAEALVSAFNRDFTGRKNILSAIEVATRSLIDREIVDPRRVGITGLSDGCTTVQFAAIHSVLFSAGSVSGCGWEPVQDAFLGPMVAQSYHKDGWPRLIDKNPKFWEQISLVDQAKRVTFPMLFQAADTEYLAMLAGFTAIRQAKIPSDMYIFPNEDHIKSQPAHRLAVYRRNLAWFDFWLKESQSAPAGASREETEWIAMKREWLSQPSSSEF